jgi:hypothetical protein
MPIAPNKFWSSNYYNHPPLTDAMVAFAEKELGVRLPSEYIDLLRIQNGGYTLGFVYPMSQPTTWSTNHVPLNDLAGIVVDPNHDTAVNLLATPHMSQEWGLPPRQVLLSGDGHWWITLDYRRDAEPSVSWIDVECGEDVQVAPTFSAFLDGLRPASNFDVESN